METGGYLGDVGFEIAGNQYVVFAYYAVFGGAGVCVIFVGLGGQIEVCEGI